MDAVVRRNRSGRAQGVQAVSGQLCRVDVIADRPGPCRLGQQVPDQIREFLVCLGYLLSAVQERTEFACTAPGDERIGLQYPFQPLPGITAPMPERGELFEVDRDVTFMPGKQNGLDVREVPVQGRARDACLLGDLGHGDRPQPLLGDQPPGGVQDGFDHGMAVRPDRLIPQLGHTTTVFAPPPISKTHRLDTDTVSHKLGA